MKQHFVGERGSVTLCTRVAPEVRHAILGSLKEFAQKAKEKIEDFVEENPFGHSKNDFDDNDVQEIPSPQAKGVLASKEKRKATIGINVYFKVGHDTS
ncbi:hypothetical protein ACH5RR_040728 [Cinchona calisaya]|uniref:Uncharacterized protein n=1 Tax=Cinchona calisaya TaxID=153742 RepID=A0ABD2XU69_9GENT